MNSENQLNEDCNLVIRKTHFVWRAPWNDTVYVVDSDTFNFGSTNAMTQATDQAKESITSENGCSTCPLREMCEPKPTMINNYPNQNSISSAIETKFE